MKSIAVLGAGLSGLSSAFHLSRRFPNAQLTILENKHRLGGWVKSKRINNVLLEGGPRTLRPNGKSVLELINLLNLQDKVITVPKSSPAAQSRYLYIPPPSHSTTPFSLDASISGLQKIPTTAKELLQSPLTRILVPAIVKEAFTSPNRPPGVTDESFDALLSRRFGDDFARVLGSALVHGIYASDSRKLSVQSAFPSLWELENTGRGSIVRGGLLHAFLKKPLAKEEQGYDLGNVADLMQGVSVYSFKDGMQSLIDALHSDLESKPNVKIISDAPIKAITKLQPGTFEITHSTSQTLYVSHIISSLSPHALKPLLRPSPFLSIPPHTSTLMLSNPQSSVQCINLVFPCAPKHVHPQGFGYLVPRPREDYAAWNAQGHLPVLGMVFDSCSLYKQDVQEDVSEEEYYEKGEYTKVTVMLGGPYDSSVAFPSSSSQPTLPPSIAHLLSTLSTHLARPLPTPSYWEVWNNERCIPTLMPGHAERVSELRTLIEGDVKARDGDVKEATGIRLVGAGVDGVSVPDCVKSGRRAAFEI